MYSVVYKYTYKIFAAFTAVEKIPALHPLIKELLDHWESQNIKLI